jgi:uncharacterized protein
MSDKRPSRLRFNYGFLLEATLGTSRVTELDYPDVYAEDIVLRPLQGQITATRTSEGIYISGWLKSKFPVECTRCLEPAEQSVHIKLDDLFFSPPHLAPAGEHVVGENGFIDLAPLIRELSILALPIQPLCQPDCQGLCQECGQNLNEGDCDCQDDDIDPRLAKLRQLLD